MFLKLSFVMLITVGAFGEKNTNESYQHLLQALVPMFNPLNGLSFDGPASISNAQTTVNKNKFPTLEQMMYYNYYAASTYYGYDHDDLTCEYCFKFKDDVCDHKGTVEMESRRPTFCS